MNAQRSKLAKVKRTNQQTSKPANQQKGLITKQQSNKPTKELKQTSWPIKQQTQLANVFALCKNLITNGVTTWALFQRGIR
ncbi:hypothetical protein BSK48_26635 [Paenibacillus odorifer]|nr:hypothetical protein BSK48_26635 [Paenibacillus odorifer]